MRKALALFAAAAGLTAAFAMAAVAADQPVTPFPSPTVGDVFVAAQTVTTDGAMGNYFKPASTVVFRAYAVDGKTHKVLLAKDVKYFYVSIPGASNVKLKYDPKAPGATARMAWTGTWSVPAAYPAGIVGFKVLVKADSKRRGQFVQFPVASAQLTISDSPAPTYGPGPGASTAAPAAKLDLSLYVDAVNGTRPAATAPRPVGCTQTNVFKRGEQLVVRAWGVDMATGDVLTSDNIDTATATLVGLPALTLNWGGHGVVGSKVWFWANAWQIPKDYPLGDSIMKVVFKTDGGKTGTFDYPLTIIP
jgi:hypothetical protein